MGFSEIATHSVWFFLFVAIATPVGSDAVQVWNGLEDARGDAREFRFERQGTEIEIVSVEHDIGAEKFTVVARNDGTTPLRMDETELLLDGLVTAYAVTVEGVSTNHWQAGEEATFVVTAVVTPPRKVLLVAENGVRSYGVFVPPLLHSANVTTYKGAALTTSFKNGDTVTMKVTVHDADHKLVSGASVTLELVNPNGGKETFGPATTDASGVASVDRKLTGSDPSGTYTINVTKLSKAGYTQDLDSSEERSATFQKT